jgi:rfaE bifunctional protein nucleotidyltransferase chain/domain/rfaE bifunctional protein kinase chain/domain
VLVVGDTLLDRDVVGAAERLAPDAPAPVLDERDIVERPGGAGLAAVLLARSGRRVRLLTALADDGAGARVRELLAAEGVELAAVPFAGGATREKTRMLAGGRPLLRWDRGEPGPFFVDRPTLAEAVSDAGSVLVSDYGAGMTADPLVRDWLAECAAALPVVWDPHPRGAGPVPGCAAVTPNLVEARGLAAALGAGGAADTGSRVAEAARLARDLHAAWRCGAVVVTLGEAGALVGFGDGAPLVASPTGVGAAAVDTCGAGDRLAGELAARLGDGRLVSEAVRDSVEAATVFVASGGAGGLGPTAAGPDPAGAADTLPTWPEPAGGWAAADAVTRRVRTAGGTVVATGGVFDLVHAGHVRYLERARALGDALVVLVNDDPSVRRLKGPERPLQPLPDRVAVLSALTAVDAVVPFGEDTPQAALERLRPDLWVKGGDYTGVDLPESPAVARWGGQVVSVPYLDGRSTTGLLGRARAAGVADLVPSRPGGAHAPDPGAVHGAPRLPEGTP